MSRLFLGLDSSTQSLSATLVDLDSRKVVYEQSLNFSSELPAYGTDHGVLTGANPTVVHAPPLMWAEALDAVFAQMKAQGVALGEVLAVSGSGQQHGSVYLNAAGRNAIRNLDTSKSLVENLASVFARSTSPIWMDSSTTAECDEIMEALGGPAATARATGSVAFERFTGPQIRKFFKEDPQAYALTDQVCLVSSFMASLLAGDMVPIDHGDGAGMNLMDIAGKVWHDQALEATAPALAAKLLPPVASSTVTGKVAPYFAAKYGLNPDALHVVWSGDNPNSLIGLGLIKPGDVAISLGTSDTFFGVMSVCRVDPRGEGHVFVSPTGDYMSLICFKNGSLAREKIRDQFGLDWQGFGDAIDRTPVGNGGGLMLPYYEPEIVPKVLQPGVVRQGVAEDSADANCRAVVESQMLSMRLHSQWMGVKPSRIFVTGGASGSAPIRRIIADVHQCPVYRLEVGNSAALGAALRAAHACLGQSGAASWEDVVEGFVSVDSGSVLQPSAEAAVVYDDALERYAALEARRLRR